MFSTMCLPTKESHTGLKYLQLHMQQLVTNDGMSIKLNSKRNTKSLVTLKTKTQVS